MVEDGEGRLRALLPATRQAELLASHAGLTYGGFVVDATMTTPLMLQVLDATRAALRGVGVERLAYKTVPHVYHRVPAEEDRYALFRAGAHLVRSDVLSVVSPGARLPVQERRRRGARKAAKAGVEVRRSADLAGYWRLLEASLAERHGTRPVHSLPEIELLAARFPAEIVLWTAERAGELLGGVLIYESDRVAHAQYIGASQAGRELSALDLLFEQLIAQHYSAKPWFDFGISTEEAGRLLNEGLIEQKEGFGARAVVHDFYELSV